MNKLDKEIMSIFWADQSHELSLYEVFDRINDQRRISGEEAVKYPTLESAIRRLVQRGDVNAHKMPKSVTYRAVRGKSEAGLQALNSIANEFFGGDLSVVLPKLAGGDARLTPDVHALLEKLKDLSPTEE